MPTMQQLYIRCKSIPLENEVVEKRKRDNKDEKSYSIF